MKKPLYILLSFLLIFLPTLRVDAQDMKDVKVLKRHNAGKMTAMTGAGFVLGGGAMMLSELYDNHSNNGGAYIAGALTASVGTIMSLIGVPMWVIGPSNYTDRSRTHLKGVSAVVGLEVMNSLFLNVDLIGGYQLNNNLFVGGGISAQKLLIAKGFCLPILVDIRYTLSEARYAPYISTELGYDIVRKGLYAELNIGTRICEANNSWWFGTNVSYLKSDNIVACGLSLSYSF